MQRVDTSTTSMVELVANPSIIFMECGVGEWVCVWAWVCVGVWAR